MICKLQTSGGVDAKCVSAYISFKNVFIDVSFYAYKIGYRSIQVKYAYVDESLQWTKTHYRLRAVYPLFGDSDVLV